MTVICRGLVILLAISSSLCLGRSYDDVKASGYLEIAVYRDFSPYSFELNGEAAGIDVEIGKLIAEQLGVEPRWFWLTAGETVEDDLRNAVWKGHYIHRRVADLMLRVPYDRNFSFARDGYGNPRNDLVVMFGPYQNEQWVIARNLEKVGAVRNLAIFQYEKIGVELDSLPDFYLSGALLGRLRNQVVHYPDVFLALEDLSAGNLAAVAGTRAQVEWGLGADGRSLYDVDDAGFENLVARSWDIGMAVKHTYRQLAYAIEGITESLVRSGRVGDIFAEHGLSYDVPSLYQADSPALTANP